MRFFKFCCDKNDILKNVITELPNSYERGFKAFPFSNTDIKKYLKTLTNKLLDCNFTDCEFTDWDFEKTHTIIEEFLRNSFYFEKLDSKTQQHFLDKLVFLLSSQSVDKNDQLPVVCASAAQLLDCLPLSSTQQNQIMDSIIGSGEPKEIFYRLLIISELPNLFKLLSKEQQQVVFNDLILLLNHTSLLPSKLMLLLRKIESFTLFKENEPLILSALTQNSSFYLKQEYDDQTLKEWFILIRFLYDYSQHPERLIQLLVGQLISNSEWLEYYFFVDKLWGDLIWLFKADVISYEQKESIIHFLHGLLAEYPDSFELMIAVFFLKKLLNPFIPVDNSEFKAILRERIKAKDDLDLRLTAKAIIESQEFYSTLEAQDILIDAAACINYPASAYFLKYCFVLINKFSYAFSDLAEEQRQLILNNLVDYMYVANRYAWGSFPLILSAFRSCIQSLNFEQRRQSIEKLFPALFEWFESYSHYLRLAVSEIVIACIDDLSNEEQNYFLNELLNKFNSIGDEGNVNIENDDYLFNLMGILLISYHAVNKKFDNKITLLRYMHQFFENELFEKASAGIVLDYADIKCSP